MGCEFLYLDHSGWADVATIIGVLLGATTLVAAYRQYQSSKRASRLVHVNSLFRDFLRLEFDFHNVPHGDVVERDAARRTLQSYRMWVLEETWLWLRGVNKRRRWTAKGRAQKLELTQTWNATIDYHATRLTPKGWQDFEDSEPCYSPGFHAHVMALKLRRNLPVSG